MFYYFIVYIIASSLCSCITNDGPWICNELYIFLFIENARALHHQFIVSFHIRYKRYDIHKKYKTYTHTHTSI